MKVVGLVSGGKDSCHAMQLCKFYGHEVVALANLYPVDESVDELDSYMYQTVGHQVITALSQCVGLPLFRRKIHGQSRVKELRYTKTDGDEVEDLEVLLRAVKNRFPDLGGVSTGAIASDYQRLRVENVCSRLGLISLAYMWKQEQALLLQNMIDGGLHAVLVKVAAMGLDPHKHLGKELSALQPLLMRLQELYGCNVCGEGGEYETLTLDSPVFTNARIILDEVSIELHSADSIAPVGILRPLKFHLEGKSEDWRPDTLSEIMSEEVSGTLPSIESWIQTSCGDPGASTQCTNLVQNDLVSRKAEASVIVNRQRHSFVVLICSKQPDRIIAQELQDELDDLLKGIEGELRKENLSWADVIYVHLFLKDMTKFAKANDKYMEHITEKLCVRGVPSRCCVELPLVEGGMGGALVEIIAADCQSKQVLHVQSISCWAPCCIGPYSQATLFQGLLYMAGQLGLDPPTMTLVSGGGADEMLQALKNCEAVGGAFTSSFLSSVLSFTVYCSSAASCVERQQMEEVLGRYLQTDSRSISNANLNDNSRPAVSSYGVLPDPLILYVLVPALPKSALVEVAPLTHIMRPIEESSDYDSEQQSWWRETLADCGRIQGLSLKCGREPSFDQSAHAGVLNVQHGQRQYVCGPCKALVLPRYLCRAVSHILLRSYGENSTPGSRCEMVASSNGMLLGDLLDLSSSGKTFEGDGESENGVVPAPLEFNLTQAVSQCVHFLSLTLEDAALCWDDVIMFRVYFVVSILSAHDIDEAVEAAMQQVKNNCSRNLDCSAVVGPRPTLIPVLGVGESSEMGGVIGMELTASGGLARRL